MDVDVPLPLDKLAVPPTEGAESSNALNREGKDIEKIIFDDEILSENKNNIIPVDERVPNQISSTRVSLLDSAIFSTGYCFSQSSKVLAIFGRY
ncbi:uncharacterized protein A4U43_C10F18920 [Asparagus officinalis]|uniref:Uncharacterized protein n=1 Tax=Asparagus officinalis TaxID=4686 RepID=A0A5P1E8R4_ASPOF|nr:uncharacterized protein A4U43_C10F18920 [Asparagus officinalis]